MDIETWNAKYPTATDLETLPSPAAMAPSPEELEAIDRTKRIVFISADVTWIIGTSWLWRITNEPPSKIIDDLVKLDMLTLMWCDGEEAVCISHADDDPSLLFNYLVPTAFYDRANNRQVRHVHRVVGSA